MESENPEMGCSGGSSNAHQVNSRWNPTKEQITILENMYSQGIRTPTADQIQQITARLKAFGEIEGKNVFYWFQNHKARQRQKQKQENLASITRFLHNSNHPIFPLPSCPNGVGGTYYLPQELGEMGYYQQYPKVIIPYPAGFKRRHKLEKLLTHGYETALPDSGYSRNNVEVIETRNRGETLPLFPLHPTRNLEDKDINHVFLNDSAVSESINAIPSSSSENTIDGAVDDSDKPFFDFFSRHVESS